MYFNSLNESPAPFFLKARILRSFFCYFTCVYLAALESLFSHLFLLLLLLFILWHVRYYRKNLELCVAGAFAQ